jgi:hypothetical protein
MDNILTPEQLDNIRVRASVERNATFAALLTHIDALTAALSAAPRRHRVDEELPPHGVPVVVGRDDDDYPEAMRIAHWDEGGEHWADVHRHSWTRRSSYDWWCEVAQ